MTKSSEIGKGKQQGQNFTNLHEFLKKKRGIVKCAKKSPPPNNCTVKRKYENLREDIVGELPIYGDIFGRFYADIFGRSYDVLFHYDSHCHTLNFVSNQLSEDEID